MYVKALPYRVKVQCWECQSVNGLVWLFFNLLALDYRCLVQGDKSTASPLIKPLIQLIWLACVSHTQVSISRKGNRDLKRGKVNWAGWGVRRKKKGDRWNRSRWWERERERNEGSREWCEKIKDKVWSLLFLKVSRWTASLVLISTGGILGRRWTQAQKKQV